MVVIGFDLNVQGSRHDRCSLMDTIADLGAADRHDSDLQL